MEIAAVRIVNVNLAKLMLALVLSVTVKNAVVAKIGQAKMRNE